MAKKIVPTLRYLRGDLLALAALKVYRQNEKVTGLSFVFHATDESWLTNSLQRKDLLERTRAEWCKLAGKDFTWFPYSEDAVVRVYARFQKRSAEDLKQWERELKTAEE